MPPGSDRSSAVTRQAPGAAKPPADRRAEPQVDLGIMGFAGRQARSTAPPGPKRSAATGGAEPRKLHVLAPDEMHDHRFAPRQRPRARRRFRQRERDGRRRDADGDQRTDGEGDRPVARIPRNDRDARRMVAESRMEGLRHASQSALMAVAVSRRRRRRPAAPDAVTSSRSDRRTAMSRSLHTPPMSRPAAPTMLGLIVKWLEAVSISR